MEALLRKRLLLLIFLLKVVDAHDQSSINATAANRTVATLNGVFNYYWKGDPYHKHIKFLFACGQIGEVGTGSPGQCSCYSLTQCVNCYRWWTAILVESVASYGILMNTTNHTDVPNTVFNHSPYNSNWVPGSTYSCSYIDDFLWYGIAYLRVYDWTSVSLFTKLADHWALQM